MWRNLSGFVPALLLIGRIATAQNLPLMITSTAWPDGGVIPDMYTQVAANPISPAFKWANTPAGARSFVFLMRHLNATGGVDGQVEWLLWNVPPLAFALAEDMPQGEFLPSGSRQTGRMGPFYSGPVSPPPGATHHYVFELFALDVAPEIQATSIDQVWPELSSAMQGHVLGKAVWAGVFRRPL